MSMPRSPGRHGCSIRRAACEADIVLALQTYFPADFFQEFTPLRREIAEAVPDYRGIEVTS